MTTFARKLSVEEEITLKEFVASDDRVTCNRADSILMSANRKSTKHIAPDVVLSERSVRNNVKAFNALWSSSRGQDQVATLLLSQMHVRELESCIPYYPGFAV